MASHGRRVLLVGDARVGKSTLIAVRKGHRPFLDKYTPYFSHGSFTGLKLGSWEGEPDFLKTTRKTLKRKGLNKSILQTQLYIHNLSHTVPLQTPLPHCCLSSVAAVVFCFSIGDERSFENIKNKVNWASLNNPLGLRSRELTC